MSNGSLSRSIAYNIPNLPFTGSVMFEQNLKVVFDLLNCSIQSRSYYFPQQQNGSRWKHFDALSKPDHRYFRLSLLNFFFV